MSSQDSLKQTDESPVSEITPSHPYATPLPGALIYPGFVFTGVLTTLLGPMLPTLTRRLDLDDSRAGLFFVAQFVGSTLGALLTTKLSFVTARDKLLAGFFLLTVGTPGLLGGRSLAMASVFGYGLGLGLIIPTANIAIAEQTSDEKRGSALNLLNFAWVSGAVLCGPLIRWLAHGDDPSRFLYLIAGCLCLVSVSFSWASYKSGLHVITERIAPSNDNRPGPRLGLVALWFGSLLFLYVGLENSIAGWTATYSERLGSLEARALLAPSAFWAAILSGRLLAYGLLKRVDDHRLFQLSSAIATLGIGALLLLKDPLATLCATALAGLGLAPIFSFIIASFTRQFGGASSRFAGAVFALGGLGGALLPFATGMLSSYFQSLRIGLTLCLVEIFCLAFVAWRIRRHHS